MKIFFATPVHERLHPLQVRSVLEASRVLLDVGHEIEHAWTIGVDVDEARQGLFAEFLRGDASHLFMVDADIGFEPDLVLRMMAVGKSLVSAAVPVRSLDIHEAVKTGFPTDALFFAGEPGFSKEEAFVGQDKLLASRLGSTALMLLSRVGAEQMERAHPGSAFEPFIEGDLAMGEDLSFFTRWKALPEKVWVLTTSTISHSGPVTIQGNYSLAQAEAEHPKIVRSWPYEERALPGDLR